MKHRVIEIAGLAVIALATTIHANAEPESKETKTIHQCLGKGMAEYTSVLGEPKVNDSKRKGYVRLIHTYKTEAISSLNVHQLPEYTVPIWITITFKETPKTWQEALKLAGLSEEGITAKTVGSGSTAGVVFEGFKSTDGKLWAVEFDPTKENLNAPCHIEIQPKNLADYKKSSGPADALAATPAQLQAQLASDDAATKVEALKQLAALGPAAKDMLPMVEQCIRNRQWDIQLNAVRALTKIAGQAEAVKIFDRIARDPSATPGAGAALVGLEECGKAALPTVEWAIKQKNEGLRNQALITAAIIDTDGALYSDIVPMLVGQPEGVTYSARKYLLANGIRRFHNDNKRWPKDFIEVEAYVRESNPLITLAQLTAKSQIRFELRPDGSLNVQTYAPQPDGSYKIGQWFHIMKPEKK